MLASLRHPDSASKAKKTIALSLASLTNTCLNVALQVLIARCLDKQEVAVYMQSLLVYNTLLPFLQLGVNNGLYYWLTRREDESREVMAEGMFLVGASGALVSLFILLGGNSLLADFMKNAALSETSFWLIPYMLICVPESLAFVGFVYCNRVRFVAYYNAVKTFVCVLILVLVTQLSNSGSVLFIMRVLTGCFFGLSSIYLLYKFALPRTAVRIRMTGLRRILVVSLPLSLATMAGTVSVNLDLWIVSSMLTTEEFAIYRMGAYELPVIGIITGAVSTVVTVDMNKAGKSGDIIGALAIFRNVAAKTALVIMPCMIFFLFAAKDFICLLFTRAYLEAVPVFIIYQLSLPVRCVLFGPLLVALGKSRYMMRKEMWALGLNLILSIITVYLWGMLGAAISTVFVRIVYSVPYYLYHLAKWSGVPWYNILPFKNMIIYMILSMPGAIIGWSVSEYIGGIELLKVTILFMIFMVITLGMYYKYLHYSPRDVMRVIR